MKDLLQVIVATFLLIAVAVIWNIFTEATEAKVKAAERQARANGLRSCAVCSGAVSIDARFCPHCGTGKF